MRSAKTMKSTLAAITIGLALTLGTNQANAVTTTLYDGSLGNFPGQQGQLLPGAIESSGLPSFPPGLNFPNETISGGGVQMNTNANVSPGIQLEYSGYSNYNPLTETFVNSPLPYTLDPSVGYSIRFNVTLDSTTSNSEDRAAFSVIATGVRKSINRDSF